MMKLLQDYLAPKAMKGEGGRKKISAFPGHVPRWYMEFYILKTAFSSRIPERYLEFYIF